MILSIVTFLVFEKSRKSSDRQGRAVCVALCFFLAYALFGPSRKDGLTHRSSRSSGDWKYIGPVSRPAKAKERDRERASLPVSIHRTPRAGVPCASFCSQGTIYVLINLENTPLERSKALKTPGWRRPRRTPFSGPINPSVSIRR